MSEQRHHERRPRRSVKGLATLAAGAIVCATMIASAYAGEPCCSILGVDKARGTVTAFERASGNIFTFSVKNKAQLAGLAPCQALDANISGMKSGQAFNVDLPASGKTAPGAPPNEAKRTAHKAAEVRGGGRPTPAEPCCEMTKAPGSAGRLLGMQSHAKFEGVEIYLTELKRSGGDLVTATCLYCNTGAKRVDLAADLRARAQGKAKLLDNANRIEYQVARVGGRHGEALMSDHGPGLKLQPRQAVKSWVKFAAPQSDKVTLVWPGAAEPFDDVPISK